MIRRVAGETGNVGVLVSFCPVIAGLERGAFTGWFWVGDGEGMSGSAADGVDAFPGDMEPVFDFFERDIGLVIQLEDGCFVFFGDELWGRLEHLNSFSDGA